MVNYFTKDRGTPEWVGAVSNASDKYAISPMQKANDAVQGAADWVNNAAESMGIPTSVLAKENKNRGVSSAVQRLLSTIDRTAQRSYIGLGFGDASKNKPNTRSVITQTPEAIILIKKRVFSSLLDNFDPKNLSKDEIHFLRASKKLFENKCNQISAYEKLTKLNKVIVDTGVVTTPIANAIYQVINEIEGSDFNAGGGGYLFGLNVNEKLQPGQQSTRDFLLSNKDGIKRIRDALTLNGFSQTTTWIGNTVNEKQAPLGFGTGVIELTLATTINTKVSTTLGDSTCTFNLSDPCKLFFIDETDIERAILQTSYEKKFSIINITAEMLSNETEEMKQQLNQLRLSRGVSILTYRIDITTRVYNKVSIVLDRVGFELTKSDGSGIDYENLAAKHPIETFTAEEVKLTNKIYKNLFKILQIRAGDYTDYKSYNANVNYTRKLMRLNYLGQQIIQPMDTVTVFIDSQTIDDKLISYGISSSFADMTNTFTGAKNAGSFNLGLSKGVGGIFGTTNFTSLLDSTVGKLKKLGDFNGLNRDNSLKNLLAGKDFPAWLWDKLRGNFTGGNFGTCVFCGIIERASESYSDGSYTIQVTAKDNASYFEQGYLQTKPGIDQFNGHLYDPLTPFDFEFDSATGLLPDVASFKLLDENRQLLKDGRVSIPDGKHAGEAATLKHFGDPDIEPTVALSTISETFQSIANRIYTAPDGFVYRWKRGIGTAIINQSGTPDGSLSSKLVYENVAQVNMTDPFGGQDFVNVLSILICGEPYNFNTFFQAAQKWGTISTQSDFNPDADFFQGLFGRIKKQNKIWGDFIPFKKITMDPKTFGISMALQMMVYAHSTAITKAQDEKAKLLSKLMQYEGNSNTFDLSQFQAPITANAVVPVISTLHPQITVPIIRQILQLDALIQIHTEIIAQSLRTTGKGTVIAVGDTVFYNNTDDLKTSGDITKATSLLQSDQHEITKRRLWQVKANSDRNLFIVGSEYDTDYDIQTIATNLAGNFDFINTNWQTIKEKIKSVAVDVLGMEMFANTQGHIELRTPKYNRVPSSVLFEMLRRKSEYNIQVYPDFIEKMFKNQIETVFSEIEELEDQIRLRCVALGAGAYGDSSMEDFLSGSDKIKGGAFLFTTDANGTLSSIRQATKQINNNYSEAFADSQKSVFQITPELDTFFKRNPDENISKFQAQASTTKSQFDVVKQIDNYNGIVKTFANQLNYIGQQIDGAQDIKARLSQKLGKPADQFSIEKLLPNSKDGKLSPIDINTLQKQIQGLITRRYEALQIAVNLVKNIDDAARVNSPDNTILSKLILPNLFGTDNVPDFLKDLIENENIDDYGLDSGKRFVLREKDIISMSYQLENPEYTAVEVSGAEMGGLVGGQGFNVGNNMQLANVYAVDYDMWRMYGFKSMQTKHLPFLNNPELQLAPYALFLLNKERAKLFSSNVVMRGNEFMQPGETYFIQERGMLFYAKSVSHSFTYGGSFKTTLDMHYGHVPGEYIPTPLDIIGKSIYRGEHFNVGNYRIARSGTIANTLGTNLGALVFNNASASGLTSNKTPQEQLLSDSVWGVRNANTIEDIKGKILFLADKTLKQSNSKFKGITIRVYSEDTNLYNAAKYVRDQLQKVIPLSKIIGGKDSDGANKVSTGVPMIVNFGTGVSRRNPSSEAWSAIKEMNKFAAAAMDAGNKEYEKKLGDMLALFIIDVWLEDITVSNEKIIKESKKDAFQPISIDTSQSSGNTQTSISLSNMYSKYNEIKKGANIDQFATIITITTPDTTK